MKHLKFIFFLGSNEWCFINYISGYFQYEKGGYTWETVGGHFYAGVTTVLTLSILSFISI
jgi:hypothetical protein